MRSHISGQNFKPHPVGLLLGMLFEQRHRSVKDRTSADTSIGIVGHAASPYGSRTRVPHDGLASASFDVAARHTCAKRWSCITVVLHSGWTRPLIAVEPAKKQTGRDHAGDPVVDSCRRCFANRVASAIQLLVSVPIALPVAQEKPGGRRPSQQSQCRKGKLLVGLRSPEDLLFRGCFSRRHPLVPAADRPHCGVLGRLQPRPTRHALSQVASSL